ncbi:hypothetical protein GCM10010357_28750 [Streptomyces luteireticuli]|uniref:Uncharacterized protein n=2 Tax=Streptomyces luteireticuli TaxID=173858 RepID=A0ABN0YR27_9ACTN
MLRRNNGAPGVEAQLGAGMTSCHCDQPGTAREFRLCAGWLAVVGVDHVEVRMAVLVEALPVEVLRPGAGWPELHAGLGELLEAREQQLGEG